MMVSLVMPFYLNGSMLALQFAEWRLWSAKAKAQIEVVVVDDGSPEPAAAITRPKGLPALSIYRVTEDRPWHQHAARNLGAHVAAAPWLLLTDMDHVLTAEAADALLKRLHELDPGTAYFLNRIEADTGEPTRNDRGEAKPHPNSFVMTRDLYWKVGGYDEWFTGIYGTDGFFRERLFAVAKKGLLKKVPLVRYWRGLVADASTTTLARKEGRKPGEKQAIRAAKAAAGKLGEIKVLDFPWERVL